MSAIPEPKKSLGQHWLNDLASLDAMVEAAAIIPKDTVLEIGPGPGALTRQLVKSAGKVVAVEFDEKLAQALPQRVSAPNLEVIQADILHFDFTTLPAGYKVAANIPYYLTSNLLRVLCESANPFSTCALLMQKEVAQRVCAKPGDMSLLSVSVQFYCQAYLGELVPAYLFTPPPKVDSQILILTRRPKPLFSDIDSQVFFRVVKAGFSQRRKTLLNSLSSGLSLTKEKTISLLASVDVMPERRAQTLSLEEWYLLCKNYIKNVS